MNTIKTVGLEKKYGRKHVFTELNMDLAGNRFVVLLGANGIGKTTFLKLCAGLAPYHAGKLSVNGKSERSDLTNEVAYVSEESHFDAFLTVQEVMDVHARQFRGFQRERADEMVHRVELPTQTKMRALSRGQRHLLAMIIAIAKPHPMIVADEMLANLDTAKKQALLSILTDVVMDEGRMIVMATHAYEDVEMLADGAVFLKQEEVLVISDLEEWRMQHGSSLKGLFDEVGRV
ncbi:ATP-binding cassette domain-containing protein [Shouchella shacheensis]|uniref:ATP-binding cassette domain-containing protein n=1 Tax=Shouchella shacheensis TaxID=1649580 RepID=UPI0007403C21|nr:ATP-binding cassette domain-containing protein [Shouchella shacheensis]